MKSDQKTILLQYLDAFLSEPNVVNGGLSEEYDAFDELRITALPELKSLVEQFITGKINLSEFKEFHDLKSREHPYWGFGGFSGQMQLNQFSNNIEGDDKEIIFRNSVKIPKTENEAREKIDTLVKYITDKRATSEKRRSLPRAASAKYVLTYFWEIQDHMKWPIYYNSSQKVLESIGVLDGQGSEGESYLEFLNVMRETVVLYSIHINNRKIKYPFWLVEHALWKPFLSANTRTGVPTDEANGKQKPTLNEPKPFEKVEAIAITNEWLPPIIADLNELASNRETVWSKKHSLKPEKALETKVRIAFTLLGYEAVELGQGTGRQPDGFAISLNSGTDGDYAIIFDAKSRDEHFSVGTADREMNEYIRRKVEELKKRRVSRYYFLIVSSEFDQSSKSLSRIKDVFRLTRVPIVMLKAADLLFLIEEKLKDTDLTHDRLESLFLETGTLTRDKIVDILGIR